MYRDCIAIAIYSWATMDTATGTRHLTAVFDGDLVHLTCCLRNAKKNYLFETLRDLDLCIHIGVSPTEDCKTLFIHAFIEVKFPFETAVCLEMLNSDRSSGELLIATRVYLLYLLA